MIEPRASWNTDYFAYLSDCKANVTVALGDARRMMTAETNRYDVLVIDAYSGDAIPFHLATKEAFRLYLDRLNPGGILAVHISNRFLTLAMNMLFGAKLSEYHTGYRAFSRELLEKLPLEENTDDFAFDAQMLAEILWTGATIGEVSCPTVYFKDASSISFVRSCTYGVGCLKTALLYRLCRVGVMRSEKFGEMRECGNA